MTVGLLKLRFFYKIAVLLGPKI